MAVSLWYQLWRIYCIMIYVWTRVNKSSSKTKTSLFHSMRLWFWDSSVYIWMRYELCIYLSVFWYFVFVRENQRCFFSVHAIVIWVIIGVDSKTLFCSVLFKYKSVGWIIKDKDDHKNVANEMIVISIKTGLALWLSVCDINFGGSTALWSTCEPF